MAEFIANPRRAPRAPARCRAAVVSPQGHFDADTEDIGTMGCQVVSPKLVRRGDMLQLVVGNERLRERLKATGRVAWVSPQPPYRVGIAFDEASHPEAARWFESLVAAFPGLGGYRRVPDRIRADQMVYLAPPPKFLLDFTREEAKVLRAIASGARIDELRAQLKDGWPSALRALFSLIARQVVTFQRGQAIHPDNWTSILHDLEASLAVESMAAAPPAVLASPGAAPKVISTPQSLRPTNQRGVPSRSGDSLDHDLDRSGRFGVRREEAFDRPGWAESTRDGAAPDRQGAGSGWAAGSRQRSVSAQAAYDRALHELEGANYNAAIASLRQALALAPGDPEIAARLGKLAFRGTGK